MSTPEETEAELGLIEQAMLQEQENYRATGYMACFQGTNLHRTFIAIGVQCLQQAQGNSFITTYLVIFLKQVGMDDPQLIACASMCCSLGGSMAAFYLSDKIGRRPMLLGGSFFMAALMWIISGLAGFTPGGISGSSAQGCVAAMLLYVSEVTSRVASLAFSGSNLFYLAECFRCRLLGLSDVGGNRYEFCLLEAPWYTTVTIPEYTTNRIVLIVAEVSTTQLRERTISIATMASFSTSIVITYVNPFVQNEPGNLGSKVGMIYGGVSILALVFVFLIVPEMKGRSLEELDELFHSRVKPWRSTNFVATGIGAQITNIQGVKEEEDAAKVVEDVDEVEEADRDRKLAA